MAKKPDMTSQRIAALELALAPFVAHGRQLRAGDRRGTAVKPVHDAGRHTLTMGDFDMAVAAMECGDER